MNIFRRQADFWANLGRQLALLCAVSGVALTTEAADSALPKAVRIAAIAYFENNKQVYIDSSAVVAQQGWLEQELHKRGVALEWVPAPHTNVGPVINEAFANQSTDFAGYGDLPSIILNAGGVETRVLVPTGRGMDTFLVVPTGSTAKTIQDLKGKRIAIHRGRPWEVPFIRMLEANGLSYKDFKILNINPVAGAAALAANGVDAIYTLNDAYLLEDKQVGKIIWSTKSAPADWRMRAELWGSKAFIDRYPELTQLVATAYVKAAYWSSQPENEDALVKIRTRSGAPESVIRREYKDGVAWKDRWSPLFDSYVAVHYQHTIDYALDKKLIRKPVDVKQLIDVRFAQQALRDLKLENYWAPATIAANPQTSLVLNERAAEKAPDASAKAPAR